MPTLLVTGAGRGIGNTLVRRASARGDTVFAAVRKQQDFAKFSGMAGVHPVLMDVSDDASVEAAFAVIDRALAGKPLNGVVHCAAVQPCGAIEVLPVATFAEVLNNNTLGSLRVLKGSIPRLRGHGGRIVLVTSLWGRAASPMLAPYCASKHAIEALADVARRETIGMNLHVIVAQPGVVHTDMADLEADNAARALEALSPEHKQRYGNLYRRYQNLVKGGQKGGISADEAAANIERALTAAKPKRRYRFGMDSKAVVFLQWLLPDGLMDFALGKSVNHEPL